MKDKLQLFILLSLLSGISVLLFYPFFSELNTYWQHDRESSYVFLIPLFSAYFLWVQREKLRELQFNRDEPFFSKGGLVLLICGLGLFIIGRYTYVLFAEALAFVVIMAAAVLFIYGKDLFKITLVPILFLLFMLPIPYPVYYAVAGPLKYFIAYMAATFLSFVNIPVFLEGNVIHLTSISLLVHETCSGLRTVISLIAISTAFAYLFLKSYRSWIAIIAAAVIVGIFVNVMRIFAVGLLSYMYDSTVAMDFHKYAWGFVTPVGVITIFLIGYILRWYEERRDT
ncbi:MAG TPA: exosortase/archaeosortase family protein [Nitrospirae bacterium]|nr:exosortase/archaeosortase family protein [Nitrospirota bacterium]